MVEILKRSMLSFSFLVSLGNLSRVCEIFEISSETLEMIHVRLARFFSSEETSEKRDTSAGQFVSHLCLGECSSPFFWYLLEL